MKIVPAQKEKERTHKVLVKFLVAVPDTDEEEKCCLDALLLASESTSAKVAMIDFVKKVTGFYVTPCDSDRVVIEVENWPPSEKPAERQTKRKRRKLNIK